jgi:hypothetical protein
LSEIKSTLDLIMERTRGLALSDKEREDLHAEELLKKAKGLKLKIVDDPDSYSRVLDLTDFAEEKDRKAVESKLWELLIQDIPEDDSVYNYLRMLIKLPLAGSRAPVIDRMRHELRSVTKESAADKKKFLNRERKKLADIGISGSAVVPRLPKDFGLGAEFKEAIAKYRSELMR